MYCRCDRRPPMPSEPRPLLRIPSVDAKEMQEALDRVIVALVAKKMHARPGTSLSSRQLVPERLRTTLHDRSSCMLRLARMNDDDSINPLMQAMRRSENSRKHTRLAILLYWRSNLSGRNKKPSPNGCPAPSITCWPAWLACSRSSMRTREASSSARCEVYESTT